jgi:phage/plasmid-associated DNA primase
MANAVQNPDKPGQVAIVLRGGQGTGKGTFAKMLGKLFGGHYKYVNNPKHVTGQFNSMLKDAVLVFADECFVANDPASESALKSLITEEKIRTEQKNIDNMESRNCIHLIMATNKEWAIAADHRSTPRWRTAGTRP